MVDLKLDFDEGIILQGSYCGRYGSSEIELDEIYLTNKNLICIYEKSNGMFSKSETITESIPLESIKVINGNVQVMEVDNDEYGLGLQILFKNGTRELFVFDNPKKELPKWKNAIVARINGEPIPTEEKPSKKEKVAAFAGATAFASKIKSAVDSTKQTFSDISQQVKETATSAFDTEKPEVVEEKAEPISDEVKYIYCSNCGEKLISTAKFCQSCGAKVGTVIVEQKTSQKEDVEENPVVSPKEPIEPKADDEPVIKVTQEEYTERKTVYEGKIHKCPNCGEVLNAFTSNCPSCGYELRGTFGNSSVRELAAKLEAIESKRENVKSNAIKSLYFGKAMTKTDEQKISLIRSFPIPNTKEDLYEFLVLSQSNIDIALYEEGNQFKINSARGAISEAWKAKFEQAYQKAKLVFANDTRMSEIQKLYESTQKTVRRAKTKTLRLVGIIYGILFGVIGITLILVFTLTANSEKKEIQRLDNIVIEIEAALDNGDYKLALMNADRLDFTGSDTELNRDWEIKREYWIDKVIEEAAEDGVVLERPVETEYSDEDASSQFDLTKENSIGATQYSFKYSNYLEVKQELEERGFTNVKTEGLKDLKTDWMSQDGTVEKVTVDGETGFPADIAFPLDVEIVIYYHSFKD